MKPKNLARGILAFIGFCLILFITGLFTRCTPFQRLQQLKKDAPELFETKRDTVLNTVTIQGSSLQGKGDVQTSTVFLSNTMSIRYFTNNNNYTIDGSCFPQVVTVTSYVITDGINQKEYFKQEMADVWNRIKYYLYGFLIFVGVLFIVSIVLKVMGKI